MPSQDYNSRHEAEKLLKTYCSKVDLGYVPKLHLHSHQLTSFNVQLQAPQIEKRQPQDVDDKQVDQL